jgi:hypothetical protein
MNPATQSPHGTVERRRQKELTERLGVMPVRRSNGTNLKWSTWKRRLGMRREATP